MDKEINKTISINLTLCYTECMNLFKGGTAFTAIDFDKIIDASFDDEETAPSQIQICIKISEEAMKHLEFMKVYLQNKEKNESQHP